MKLWGLIKMKQKHEPRNRKYFRVCGICGEKHEQSEMIRTDESPNGWMCQECAEYEDFDDDDF